MKNNRLTAQQQTELFELLWDSLQNAPKHKNVKRTGWGFKSKTGLVACIERIIFESDSLDSDSYSESNP